VTRGQVVVLLLFLALLGGGVAILGPRLARPPVPPASDRAGGGEAGRTEGGREEAASPSTDVAPPPAAAPLPRVRLRAVGPDGPLAPASLRFAGAVAEPAEGADAVAVRTEAVGWVGAEGLAWARLPPPSETGEAVRVALERAAPPLRVRVAEADGRPAAGVPVVAGAWGPDHGERRTDAQGVAVFEGRPPGVVNLLVGGTERTGPWLRVVLGETTEVSATVEPPRVVTGRVLSSSGEPVAGAGIEGLGPGGPVGGRTSTDERGEFSWTGPFTATLALRVTAPGHAATSVEPPWPSPDDPTLRSHVEATLEPERERRSGTLSPPVSGGVARPVRLTVEPAVAAMLREVYGPEAVLADERAVEVGPGGRFEVPAPGEGLPLRLRVRGDVLPEDHVLVAGASPASLALAPQAALPEPAPPVSGAGRLEGRVVGDAGAPLPAVTVVASGLSATTDADGRFSIPGLDPALRRVEVVFGWLAGARPKGFDPAAFVVGGRADVRTDAPASLVLPRAASLSLRLVDAQDRPLSWAHLVVVDGDGSLRFDGPVAAHEGRVRLDGLEPGPAGTLHAFAPGLRRTTSVTLMAGATSDLGDVRLSPGGRVVGEVLGAGGGPLAGAVVAEVEDAWLEGATRDRVRERDRAYRRTTTAEDGTFALEGLDPSRPTALAVWAPGYAPAPRRVLWAKGSEATLKATLRPGSALRLRLVDREGASVSGAVVDLEEAHTGTHVLDLWRRAMFGEAVGSTEEMRLASRTLLIEDPRAPGRYRVGPVEPGPYEAWIERPGFRPVRRRLTVPDDAPEGEGAPLRHVRVSEMEVHVILSREGEPAAPAAPIGTVDPAPRGE
jgi:hypothetical protein